jgi:hypothetical protein
MSKVTSSEIGEILYRLYASEIEFRLENMFDDGYRWYIVGDIGERTQSVNLRRLEIDDMIMDNDEGRQRPRIEIEEMKLEREIPHFIKRDWLLRGAESQLVMAITKLAEAACSLYPDSDFAKWYLDEEDKQEGEKYLYSIHSAEKLIQLLPEETPGRNVWLDTNGVSDESQRLREKNRMETLARWNMLPGKGEEQAPDK